MVGETRRAAPSGVIPSPLSRQVVNGTVKTESEIWVPGDPELCSKTIGPPAAWNVALSFCCREKVRELIYRSVLVG